MKIIVKISDIEVVVDRPEFKEFNSELSQIKQTNDAVLPLLKQAIESANELYNNRIEQLDKQK